MSCQPPNCAQINKTLNSPTVKCVTFNLNLPFRFHNVHYQQWVFSTQVPFRKLSSEGGDNIKNLQTEKETMPWM